MTEGGRLMVIQCHLVSALEETNKGCTFSVIEATCHPESCLWGINDEQLLMVALD